MSAEPWDDKEVKRIETRRRVFRAEAWLALNRHAFAARSIDAAETAVVLVDCYRDWVFSP